jgi:hypothetical protein
MDNPDALIMNDPAPHFPMQDIRGMISIWPGLSDFRDILEFKKN